MRLRKKVNVRGTSPRNPGGSADLVPVVFIHGQPGLGSDFDLVEQHLGDGFCVLSPDRPGYGASGRAAVSMHENVEFFADLMEKTGFRPAILVGHSYGGGLAALLARAIRTS